MALVRNNIGFFSSSSITNSIKNTLIWAYEHSPINLANLTGWHHPSLSRLTGNFVLGRAANAAKNGGMGFSEEIKKLADLASNDPRGMAYCSHFTLPLLLVTRPNEIEQILYFNDTHIDRGPIMEGLVQVFGETSIFALPSNAEWRRKRNAIRQWLFTDESLEKLAGPMQEIIDGYINKQLKDDGNVPSLELFMVALTLEVFSQTLLNIQTPNAKEISEAYAKALTAASDPMKLILFKLSAIKEYFHLKTTNPFDQDRKDLQSVVLELTLKPNEEKLRETKNILQSFFDDKFQVDEDKKTRLIDATNKMRQIAEGKSSFDMALDDTILLLFAGHESTSRLLQFLVILLAKHPDMVEKARVEIEAHKPKNGIWTHDDLKNLFYLKKLIKEALRLFPPAPIIPRTVCEKFVLADIPRCKNKAEYEVAFDNRDVTKDIVLHPSNGILICPSITQRSKNHYDNPDEFQPERDQYIDSTSNDLAVKDPGTWFPFGLGNRNCVGQRFALQEAMLATIALVEKYDFKVREDSADNFLLDTFIRGTLTHVGTVRAEFTDRSENREPNKGKNAEFTAFSPGFR